MVNKQNCFTHLGVGGKVGPRVYKMETGTNQNVDPTFLFDLNAHYGPILHCLAILQNAVYNKSKTDVS